MANEQAITSNDKPKTTLLDFMRETRREISKVTWPTRKEISTSTLLIVVFALVVGTFFLIVDQAVGWIVSQILGMN